MKCTCKKDLEAKLLEKFKEAQPDATKHDVKLQGYAYVLNDDNRMKLQGSMQANMTANYTARNGNKRDKTTKTSMLFTYCPFCGVAYNDIAVAISPDFVQAPAAFMQQLQAELWQMMEDEPMLGMGNLPAMIDTINALLETLPLQAPSEGD